MTRKDHLSSTNYPYCRHSAFHSGIICIPISPYTLSALLVVKNDFLMVIEMLIFIRYNKNYCTKRVMANMS